MRRVDFHTRNVVRRLQSTSSSSSSAAHRNHRWWCIRRAEFPTAPSLGGCSFSLLPRRTCSKPTWKSFNISCVRTFSSSSSSPNHKKEEEPETKEELPKNHWLQQLKSPPNMITTARIVSTPFLSYLIVTEHYEMALYGCLAAGLSDVLDGHVAKHYNMSTVLGSYLDPFADKLLINVLSLSLWYANILPTPLICLWLSRDVALMTAACYLSANSSSTLTVQPTNISKVNTAVQFLTLYLALIQQPLDGIIPPGILETVCWVTGATTIASTWSYVGGASLAKPPRRSP